MKKIIILLIILSIFISCRKADRDSDKSIIDCQDNGIALTLITDIWKIVDEACKTNPALRASSISCAGIAYDDIVNPMLLQIDFGANGCTASDGRNRKGKIICTLSSNYTGSGTVINMSLQHFYINNYKIEGSITFTNLGLNALSQSEYKLNASHIKITEPAAKWSFFWGCDLRLVWITGEGTVNDFSDDEYKISGTTNGSNHKGNKFNTKLLNPATYKFNCHWLQNTVLEIAPQGLTKRKMTYSASCSNTANVVVNGYEYTVELP